jgi:mono/diheme cytochrome c family protein
MQKSVPILLASAVAVFALVACSGGKSSSSSTTTTTTTTQSSPAAGASAAASPAGSPAAASSGASPAATSGAMSNVAMSGAASAAAGQKVYTTNCSSCHQANGKGQTGVFPPLAGNTVVTGDPTKVIGIVKNGLSGKITVNGVTYNGQMPAWKSQLSNNDIAAVITYVRSAWGNKGSAVTSAQVAAVK